jgi:hypothetical protein
MNLSDPQKEFMALAEAVDTVKGRSNIISMFGSKEKMKEGIDELEDQGLIERVSYGVWKITDKGSRNTFSSISCNSCGAKFSSLQEVRNSGIINCTHENLNYQLEKYVEK